MAYKKGQSGNPGGRPVGALSPKTKQWQQFSEWFMSTGMQRLEQEMSKLDGKDYVLTVKDLLEYFQPKLARTEHTGKDGGNLIIQWSNGDNHNDTVHSKEDVSGVDTQQPKALEGDSSA